MSPRLSFVIPARNDGYGHGSNRRFQHSLDVLSEQLAARALDAELLIVEWNPPRDSPALSEALRFPRSGSSVSVRIIVVPQEFHARYEGHSEKAMHAAVAVNVGLRRARGHFALVRSSDVYYTDELVDAMATPGLDDGTIYRVDRYDVDLAAADTSVADRKQFLELCASHVLQHHSYRATLTEFAVRDLHTNACGDFTMMSMALWHAVRGLEEGSTVASLDADSLALHAAVASGGRQQIWSGPCRLYKPVHGQMSSRRIEQVFKPHERAFDNVIRRVTPAKTHYGLRALLDYPRRRVHPLSGTFPSFERNFLRRARRWAAGQTPHYLNDESWGLAGEALPETLVTEASWEAAARPAFRQ